MVSTNVRESTDASNISQHVPGPVRRTLLNHKSLFLLALPMGLLGLRPRPFGAALRAFKSPGRSICRTRRLSMPRGNNGAPYGIRTHVPALRGPCPRPLDEGSGLADLWAFGPKRAGSIRANFLDSSGTPLFERIVDSIRPVSDPPV
jgi:hypothetical protein